MGRNKEFTKEQVLDLTIPLFWENGFQGTSAKDIEETTGVNRSGIYGEFGSKAHLFLECISRYRDNSPVFSILKTEPLGLDNIESYLRMGVDSKLRKGCFIANTVKEIATCPPEVKEIIHSHVTSFSNEIYKNMLCTNLKKDAKKMTSLIITFSTGLNININMIAVKDASAQIKSFMGFLHALDALKKAEEMR